METKDKKDKKATLTSEELRIVLTAASIWCAMAQDREDQEMAEMAQRCQAILHKIGEIIDNDNKTSDLIAR